VDRKKKDGRNSNTFEKAVSDEKAGADGYPLEALRHLRPVHMGDFRLPPRS
jgi:hypothetical protein